MKLFLSHRKGIISNFIIFKVIEPVELVNGYEVISRHVKHKEIFSVSSDLLDSPSLGIGQDLLSDCPTLTDLMGVIEQMGLTHLFVSAAMNCGIEVYTFTGE